MASKTLSILTAFLLFAAFAKAQVTVGRSVKQEIQVSSETGNPTATLSVTQVKTVLPNSKVVDGSIIALFDPSSRLFWWMHQSSIGESDPEKVLNEFLYSTAFSVHPEQIVSLSVDGRSLWALTSEMRVSSLDEGVGKVSGLLPEALPELMSGKTLKFQRVPLAPVVRPTFLDPKNFGDPAVRLKVGKVERSAPGWKVEIKNDRDESETIILSNDFKTATSAPQ
jgi:hypothetical protein